MFVVETQTANCLAHYHALLRCVGLNNNLEKKLFIITFSTSWLMSKSWSVAHTGAAVGSVMLLCCPEGESDAMWLSSVSRLEVATVLMVSADASTVWSNAAASVRLLAGCWADISVCEQCGWRSTRESRCELRIFVERKPFRFYWNTFRFDWNAFRFYWNTSHTL